MEANSLDWTEGNFKISTNKSLLSLDRICELLSKSYWANNRTNEIIAKSIENSICYGVYAHGEQIGFGRIITDYATTYYICDVIIDEKYRGQGLGKKLVECMIGSEDLKNNTGILATRDAHGLYRQFGFANTENMFMLRRP